MEEQIIKEIEEVTKILNSYSKIQESIEDYFTRLNEFLDQGEE